MTRSLCFGSLLLFASWGLAAADTWYAGSLDATATPEDIAKALATAEEVPQVVQLNDPAGGGGVSTFKIITDRDTGRSKGFGRLAAAGLVGFPLGEVDPCTFADDTDAAARAVQASNAAAAAYRKAVASNHETDKQAEENRVLLTQLLAAWTAAQATLQKAVDLHTAAHEAAHVVQQRAGVALRVAEDKPTKKHLLAWLELEVESLEAEAVDKEAEDGLAAAQAAEEAASKEYHQATDQLDRLIAELKKQQEELKVLRARAEELNGKAQEANNADIVALATKGQESAAWAAAYFGELETAANDVSRLCADRGESAKAEACAALAETCAMLRSTGNTAANAWQTIVRRAMLLPPAPTFQEDPEKLPQVRLLDGILSQDDGLVALEMCISLGIAGGSPLDSAVARLTGALDSVCADGACGEEGGRITAALEDLQLKSLQSGVQMESRKYSTVSKAVKCEQAALDSVLNVIR